MCRSPLVYVLDSPGVLQPSLGDPAHAARLALAGLLPPAAAGLDDQLLTRELVKVGGLSEVEACAMLYSLTFAQLAGWEVTAAHVP